MSILAKHLPVVNEHISIQQRLAKRYENDPRRTAMHVQSRDNFIALLESMATADDMLDNLQKNVQASVQAPVLTLRPEELDGLPLELLDELSEGAVPDKVDGAILAALDARGGIASLDQIIVGIYKATKELSKRNTLTSKLYRMTQKGIIFPVPGRKGAYSLRRMTEDEAKALFGIDDAAQQQTLV